MRSGDQSSFIGGAIRAFAGLFGVPASSRSQSVIVPSAGSLPTSLDPLPVAIAIWDDEGYLCEANARFRHELGLHSDETMPGTPYCKLATRLAERFQLKVAGECAGERRIELRSDDARWLVMDERALADGGVITTVIDITAQKDSTALSDRPRAEEKQWARRYREEKVRAQAADRAKATFLAHLSHEIRTPLNHIIGFADLIRNQAYGPLGDARYLGYIDDIMRSGENLLDMFAGILELAQLEGGERVLRCEEFKASELLDTAAELFADRAQSAGLTFDVILHAEARLKADAKALKRMVGNLLDNAIRFTPPGGRVVLAMWPGEDGIVVEVSDTGVGIAEDRLKCLTDPFGVADAALARKHEGLGLGLAIAREIAQLSGGTLAIESTPACGTTAVVSLPAVVVLPLFQEAVAA